MKTEPSKKRNISVYDWVITALFIALVMVFTMFINIRLPIAANGGLIHLGNVPLFGAAMNLGKRKAAIAGGVGMAMFDLIGGWTTWAPFTFVIVALMGWFSGLLLEKNHSLSRYIMAVGLALFLKVVGYYIAEWILYGNFLAPLTSIPGNLVQVISGGIIAYPVSIALYKVLPKK